MPLRVLLQKFVTRTSATTQGIDVIITVLNDSREFALLREFSCSWDDTYRIDGRGVSFSGKDCAANVLFTRRLAPGQKVVHERTALHLSEAVPNLLTFRIGLIQPEFRLTQEEMQRFSQGQGDAWYLPEEVSRERDTGRKLTFWSEPVTLRAKTRWLSVDGSFRLALPPPQQRPRR